MVNTKFRAIALLFAICIVVSVSSLHRPAHAQDSNAISVEDLLSLKQIGYTEIDITAELRNLKEQFNPNEEDIAKLQSAGFSETFVAFVRSLQPTKTIDNDAIAELITAGKDNTAILKEIKVSERKFDTSIRGMLDLSKRVDLPKSVSRAMLDQPLTAEDVEQLVADSVGTDELLALYAIVGSEHKTFTPGAALALVKAGVTSDTISILRTPQSLTATSSEGDDETDAFSHVFGLFTLHYPKDWQFTREIIDGDVYYTARSLESTNGVPASISINLLPLRNDDTNDKLLNRMITTKRQDQPDYQPTSAAAPGAINDLQAVSRDFTSANDAGNPIQGRQYIAKGAMFAFGVTVKAADTDFDGLQPLFDTLVEKLRLRTDRFAYRKPGQRFTSEDIVNRYEESVVRVVAYDDNVSESQIGTGFVIREDGYIVTNWHVIYRLKRDNDDTPARPFKKFLVRWAEDTELREQPAELIDYRQERGVGTTYENVVDIALLKIPGDRVYTPIPTTPLSEVKLGDSLITMGFPAAGLLPGRRTTVSAGVVTRIARDRNNDVTEVLTDAAINGGNSGGPAIDLATGGVIGLNTHRARFSSAYNFTRRQPDADIQPLIDYTGIIPIDAALEDYARQMLVSTERENTVDFIDSYDIALRSKQLGSMYGARKRASEAINLNPRSPDGYSLLGQIEFDSATSDAQTNDALKTINRALELDPNHLHSLRFLAKADLDRKEFLSAIKYSNRAIDAYPNNWRGYYTRATVNQALKRHDLAISDARKSVELSADSIAEPHMLLGQILYTQKRFDDGKKAYDRAVVLDEKNVDARMGAAQYFSNKRNHFSTLVELDKLNEDVPDVPKVIAAIGHAYEKIDKFEKASETYSKAMRLYRRASEPAPGELYLRIARLHVKELRDPKTASAYYKAYLGLYYPSKESVVAHKHLQSDIVDENRTVARGHWLRIKAIEPEYKEIDKELEKYADNNLRARDIDAMIASNYPISGMMDFIENIPMDQSLFTTISNADGTKVDQAKWDTYQKQLAKTITDAGYSQRSANAIQVAVLRAMRKEFEKRGRGGDNQNANANANNNNNNVANPEPATINVVGNWTRRAQAGTVELQLKQDNTYEIYITRNNAARALGDKGNWTLENNNKTLTLRGQRGTEPLPVRMKDNGRTMILTQGTGDNKKDREYQRL